MKFELYTALRYFKSKKDNLFISKLISISILTVAIAIMVPIIVLSIVNGFHNSIKEKIIATDFQFRVRHRNNNFTQFKDVLEKINSHPDVALAIPFFESQGLIKKGGGNAYYVTVKGFYNKDITRNELFTKHVKIQASDNYFDRFKRVDDDDTVDDDTVDDDTVDDDTVDDDTVDDDTVDDDTVDDDTVDDEKESVVIQVEKYTGLSKNIINLMGTDADLEDKDEKACYTNRKEKEKPVPFQIKDKAGIVIGAALAVNINASTGEEIELLIPQGDLLYDANPDSFKSLKLSNIYSVGYAKFNKSLVFINFEAINGVFQFKNLPTDIGIHLKKGVSPGRFASFLEDLVEKNHSDLIIFNILEESIFKDFAMEKNLMLALLLFLVGSAFITIYIAIRIVVLDKRVEIGILKAVGSKSKSIKGIFVLEGLMISLIGVTIGTILGVLITVSLNEVICFIENTVHFLRLAFYKNVGDSLIESLSLRDPSDYPWHFMDPTVFYLDKFPYTVNYSDILLIGVGAIFMSIFAAYSLSKRESEQKTVDTLKL